MNPRILICAAVVSLCLVPAALSSQAVVAATGYFVNGSSTFTAADGCTASEPCQFIGQALTLASSGDLITVAGANSSFGHSFNGVYCENLAINASVTIMAAASVTPPVVDGGGAGTGCASPSPNSVVTVGANGGPFSVTIDGLRLQNGDASNNSADPGYGGGVLDLGSTVTLNDVTVTDSTGCGLAFCAGDQGLGGGISDWEGTVDLVNSTVSYNNACLSAGCATFGGQGGGIYVNSGTVDMVNSTVSKNAACSDSPSCGTHPFAQGGAMYLAEAGGTAIDSTISANLACVQVTSCPGEGGGVYVSTLPLSMSNSILAGNGVADKSGDCAGSSPSYADDAPVDGSTPVGDNLLGSTCAVSPVSNGDQISDTSHLDSLAANGGANYTMAPMAASAALDTGDAATCEAATVYDAFDQPLPGPGNLDERRISRDAPSRGVCDIGAWDGGVALPVVAAGGDHACGITSSGKALCWAGDKDDLNVPTGTFAAISSGDDQTCAVRTNASVACWGDNQFGQAHSQKGAFLQVATGRDHSCGLRASGTVSCWGDNNHGQATPLSGAFVQVTAGGYYTCALTGSGDPVCWGLNGSGSGPPMQTDFTQISAGWGFACGITTDDGGLVCWGSNHFGRATPLSGQFKQVSASRDHACAIRIDGAVACWGRNQFGQSTPPSGTFRQISAGIFYTCGIRTDDALACWGMNNKGVISKAPSSQL